MPLARPTVGVGPTTHSNAVGPSSPSTPVAAWGAAQSAFVAPAPRAGATCQLGHEVVSGTSYCALGHPISLDYVQFAASDYNQNVAAAPRPVQAGPATAYVPRVEAPNVPPAVAPQARSELAREKILRGFLVAYGSNPNGDFWPLTGGNHTIGRFGGDVHLEIPLADPTVSARHAVIKVDATTGTIAVEDIGSTNGTFVNDSPLGRGGSRELRDGDRLRIGGFTTVVKVIGAI
jgi:predicted component of type VI protein secretion system